MTVKLEQISRFAKRPEFLVAASIAVIFVATRLINILGIPMFNDEAIYIRWAEIFSLQPNQAFLSLTDGKQPLFIWLMGASLHIFNDPLLAGRVISVLAGFSSIIGLYFLTKELFRDKAVAWVSSALYIIYPYTLLYDRMALYDSLLASFAIWALYLEVLLVRRQSLKIALATALVVGAGMITKSGAIFFIYLIPASVILFPFKNKQIIHDKKFKQWLLCVTIVIAGSWLIYSTLRISSNFRYIASKNAEFTLTISEWLQSPFSQLPHTVGQLWEFIVGYSTIPFLLLILFGLVGDKKYIREKLLLLIWTIFPLAAFALFAKLLYPRYILFMLMPMLVLASYALVNLLRHIKMPVAKVVVLFLLILPMLRVDFYIISDFSKAPVPEKDRYAYIEGFYSGVGVKEIVNILEEKSRNQTIYVATHGGFGIMPQSLQNYLYQNPNLIIESFAGLGDQPPTQVIEASRRMPTYHVFTAPCPTCDSIGVAPRNWQVNEIFRKKRIENNSYITLVEIVQ